MSHSPTLGSSTPRWIAWCGLATAIISFGLGAWAYIDNEPEHKLDGIFKSLQMFHLHFQALGAQPASEGQRGFVSPALEFARFGAALVGLALVPAMLGLALFGQDIRRAWVKVFWTGQVVVCGSSTQTLSLIRDLRARNPKRGVVLIGRCPTPRSDLPPGVFYLEGNAQSGDLLKSAALHRAKYLVAMNEDDRANLEILVAAEKLCASHRMGERLDCYAHVEDTHLHVGLHKALGDGLAKSKHIRAHLFNYYELVARNLACQYPLPEALVEERPFPEHYVIVGFGAFGQNVALKLVKMGQQLVHGRVGKKDKWTVVKPRVTVIDPRGDRAAAAFLRSHPTFAEGQCTWSLYPWSCEEPEFLDLGFLDTAKVKARTSIIFCLENEATSLRTALLLQDICRTSENSKGVNAIYLRLGAPERLDGILTNLAAHRSPPHLVFFAPDKDIFSADAILRTSVDILARAVHEAYLKVAEADARANNQPPAAGSPWEELGENDRESNREAADHTWAKLRTLGYDLRPVPDNAPVPPIADELLWEITSREDELAHAEHYRWMTWRLLAGWTYGPQRTTREQIEAGKPKHHPDLVPYQKLEPATQEKDKIIIRVIPELLSKGRLQATKR